MFSSDLALHMLLMVVNSRPTMSSMSHRFGAMRM